MIELKHLKTLQALRRQGSLVEAADQLHLTQSALSHQIKALEDWLGAPLFLRKTRPLLFTPAGQRLLKLADDLLPKVQTALRDLQHLSQGQAGRLHLAIECHSCYQWLMPTLDQFRKQWPEVEVDIPSGHHFSPLNALKTQALDLVITSDPRALDGVMFFPLFHYETLLALPAGHALLQADEITPQVLAKEVLITYPVERHLLDIFTRFLEPAGVEPLEVRTAELTILMMQLVASHRGVCALPSWALAEYLQRDYVAAKRLGQTGVWGTLYAACRAQEAETGFIREFINTARQVSIEVLQDIQPA